MQVPFQPLPLRLARVDDPGARAPELFEASPQLRVQPAVLECDCGRCRHGVEQLGLVFERGVVDQRRDASAVAIDQRRRRSDGPLGNFDRLAVEVDVAREVGQPVRKRQ